MPNFPMTLQGAEKIKQELSRLKHEVRPRLSAAIASARELGDLSENAEYKAAREEQGFCEGRIQELERRLAFAQVIDVSQLPPSSVVRFGYQVQLFREKTGLSLTYQIVGEDEADLAENKLSIQSPLARALIGKSVGERLSVSIPSGEEAYIIEAVKKA